MHRPKKGPAFVMSGKLQNANFCHKFFCRFFCVHNSRGVGEAGNTDDSNIFLGKFLEQLNIKALLQHSISISCNTVFLKLQHSISIYTVFPSVATQYFYKVATQYFYKVASQYFHKVTTNTQVNPRSLPPLSLPLSQLANRPSELKVSINLASFHFTHSILCSAQLH